MKHAFPILTLILMSSMISSCHVARFFYFNFADVNDHKKFPVDTVYKGIEPFAYKQSDRPLALSAVYEETTVNLDHFLETHKTLAFLLIRNDTLLYERYFDGYDEKSIIPSFSVSKAFVSALVGIAIRDGYISGVNDSISKYIPELRNKGFDQVSLLHLLNMRSGIRFNEGYSTPFSDMAKYYYGTNLKKYVQRLRLESKPGEKYNYQSVNTLLLGIALENACGKRLPDMLSENIWSQLGMSENASWSADSKKHRTTKSFCCINATPIDFAKFGSLYLHQGEWKGEQLVPADWITSTTRIQNDSRDSQGYPYAYQWRVLASGSYFAKGVLGQYIFVNPDKKVVIVRMGSSTDDINWPGFFESILLQL